MEDRRGGAKARAVRRTVVAVVVSIGAVLGPAQVARADFGVGYTTDPGGVTVSAGGSSSPAGSGGTGGSTSGTGSGSGAAAGCTTTYQPLANANFVAELERQTPHAPDSGSWYLK